jgi:hypothetical protein
MGDIDIDYLKYKKSEWDKLDVDGEKFVFGRLKALEELAVYIDIMRESLTKQLVINGCRDCESDDDLKERWKNIKGLDNDFHEKDDDDNSVKSI